MPFSVKRFAAYIALFAALCALPAYAREDFVQKSIRALLGERPQITAPPQSVEVAFSPSGGATDLVLKTIATAKKDIRIAAYSFTSRPIANALIEAHKSGVDIAVVSDSGQKAKGSHSVIRSLAAAGIPVRIDTVHALQHDKYIVVDQNTVETGSFNYTAAAEQRNSENVIVLWNAPELAAAYGKNWQSLWDRAEPFRPLR